MLKLFEGQISFAGIHDALEACTRLSSVKNGVLRISSQEANGLIGVFCGRFITGAVLTLSGDTGFRALRKLLSAKDGTFAFMDAGEEDLPDLKQSLGVDVQMLLASGIDPQAPLTENALTGMGASSDRIKAFDTSMVIAGEPDQVRLHRIRQTYDRLVNLSQMAQDVRAVRAAVDQANLPDAPAVVEADAVLESYTRTADGAGTGEEQYFSAPRELPRGEGAADAPASRTGGPGLPPWDEPYQPPSSQPADPANPSEFKRLKKWSSVDSDRIKLATTIGATIAVIVVLLLIFQQIMAQLPKAH